MKHFFLLLLFLLPFATFADDYEPKNVAELRAQYNLLIDLRNEREISEAVFLEKTAHLRALATQKFQVDIEGLDLQQIVPAQKIDWIGSAFYIISALLILALLAPLFAKLKKPILKLIKAVVRFFADSEIFKKIAHYTLKFIYYCWEIFAYLILALGLYYFRNEYIVFLISLLVGVLLAYSILSRTKGKNRATYEHLVPRLLTFLWGGLAYFYNNHFVGFITVIAVIVSLGFIAGMGAKKSERRFVATMAGFTFFLSLFSWLLFYTNYIPALRSLQTILSVFEFGMVSLIPFTYFSSLTYLFLFQYRKDFALRVTIEFLAFASGLFVLSISLLYGISSMFWIGLFFLSFYLIVKYFELVYKNIDFVWAGLIFAGILAAVGYLIKSNIAYIMGHLEFLNL